MPNHKPILGETPVIVVGRKLLRADLNTRLLEQAKQTGLQSRQAQNQVQMQALMGKESIASYLDQEVNRIRHNTDIELSLKTLKLGFIGLNTTLTPGQAAKIIQKAKTPRGYLILNPAITSGFTTEITFYASLLRANGFNTASAVFDVSGVDSARIFLDVTAITNTPTLTVDAQTQDPLTSNWATSQADIFSGAATVGTFYASIGALGVDKNVRLLATVGNAAGDDITFSISGLLKGGTLTPVGSTIFIGPNADVNDTWGYPILPAQEKIFHLLDDVELFAFTVTNPQVVRIFQLQ